MKYFILEDDNVLREMIDYLIEKISLPSIHRRLNIFSEDDSLNIEILDNRIFLKLDDHSKQVIIKNKNLKDFLKSLHTQNPRKYIINDIVLAIFIL